MTILTALIRAVRSQRLSRRDSFNNTLLVKESFIIRLRSVKIAFKELVDICPISHVVPKQLTVQQSLSFEVTADHSSTALESKR